MRERLVEIVAEELRRYQEPPTAQELGFLGKLFGGRSADAYIAEVVVVFAFLLLAVTLVLDATTGPWSTGETSSPARSVWSASP